MKKTLLIIQLFIAVLFTGSAFSQGADCATADPFCSPSSFPASTSTVAESGPDYGCLGDQPNPAWYFLQIATSGDLEIELSNTAVEDIDFICWGPFPNLAAACGNLTGGGFFDLCTFMGTYPCGNIVDCSYEMDAVEYVDIPGAVAGQVYMMLITNFSGEVTDIVAEQISGTGSTDCSIVPPAGCNIAFNGTLTTTCDAASNYTMAGAFSYTGNPGTGTATVTVNNGVSNFTQTFNAPFVDGQNYNFSIPNIPGDGVPSTITVAFSAQPGCNDVFNFTAPDCSVPSNCLIDNFSVNISPCAPNSTFTISGDFTYIDNPGTGTIVVEVDNGTTVFTQIINPPFVDGQVTPFSISNIPSDGAASTITVYFSADPSCSQFIDYNAVADCSCLSSVGTFTTALTGQTTTNYVLCFGDNVDILSNNDFIAPEEQFAPPGPAYDPGIGFLVYSCQPTVGLTPSPTEDVPDDPCFVGIVSYYDLNETNDQYWMDNYPGVFTDNTVYFVPITFYSMAEGFYSYTNTSTPCYDLGTAFAVQYLPEITSSQVESCSAGTVTATFNGGMPEIDGSLFAVVPGTLSPATATFVNTTCADGGTIVLGNVNAGQAYSFEVADENGCSVTISGTMDGSGAATLTYPQTSYCADEPDPTPTVTGTTGGTYSSTAGLSMSAATGIIDLSASTPGTYTITYTGPGALCPPVSTFTLSINAVPVVAAGPDQSVCEGSSVTLTGSSAMAGLTYTWDNGVANGVPFTPSSTQTYTVTGVSPAGCDATDNVTVSVSANPVPDFTANTNAGCAPLTVTFTNLSGGTNCTWNFGDGTTVSGCGSVTHQFMNPGCYDITLTTELTAGCSGTAVQPDMICVSADPVAAFTPVPNILTQIDATSQMINTSTGAVTYGWNFGDGGTSLAEAPFHTFPSDAPGSYVVQLIAYNQLGCSDTAYATVVVNEDLIFYVPNVFTPDGDEFNQTFHPVFTTGFDPYDFNMLIFNRWGEVIFESNNAASGWDGTYADKLVQDGTYTWKIEFKVLENDAHKIALGHVTVIR